MPRRVNYRERDAHEVVGPTTRIRSKSTLIRIRTDSDPIERSLGEIYTISML